MRAYLKLLISGSDEATVHRFAAVSAVIVLSIATLMLSAAICISDNSAAAAGLITVTGPLATLAGYSYKKGKDAEMAKQPTPTEGAA